MSSKILETALSLRLGQTTSRILLEKTLNLCSAANQAFGSVILEADSGDVLANADKVDESISLGNNLPILSGIPLSMKDNFNVKASRTTAGSDILTSYISPYESTVSQRLKDSGSILCAKANMDEFGMGSSMLNSAYGHCINPWTILKNRYINKGALTPGGSSGASAVAVACGIVPAAIASDTGGSVRQPAAFCGLVGLKPTYGVLSRHGLISYASSMDTPGIITHSVMDAAIIYDLISGPDNLDSTSARIGFSSSFSKITPHLLKRNTLVDKFNTGATVTSDDVSEMITLSKDIQSLDGIIIGVPEEFLVEELDRTIRAHWEKSLMFLQDAGATIKRVSIPSLKVALPCYYTIACAEAASNLSRYDGIRYGKRGPEQISNTEIGHANELHSMMANTRGTGFGPEVLKRVLTGSFVLSQGAYDEYYGQANRIRLNIRKEISRVFNTNEEGVHLLVGPTTPSLPFNLNDPPDTITMMLNDFLTVPANLSGIPAITVPIGVSEGLPYDQASRADDCTFQPRPIGLQLLGPHFSELLLLQAARVVEHRVGFDRLIPSWVALNHSDEITN